MGDEDFEDQEKSRGGQQMKKRMEKQMEKQMEKNLKGGLNMKTNEKEIQKIFEEAKNQYEYLIPLYKLAFGDKWDKIEKITSGFPRVGKKLSDLIWKLAINFDKKHHPNVIAGGLWMNNGFSEGDEDFEDWEIDISDVTIIWK